MIKVGDMVQNKDRPNECWEVLAINDGVFWARSGFVYGSFVLKEFETASRGPLPCPWCGSLAKINSLSKFVGCTNGSCLACGPSDDPDYKKWNEAVKRLSSNLE